MINPKCPKCGASDGQEPSGGEQGGLFDYYCEECGCTYKAMGDAAIEVKLSGGDTVTGLTKQRVAEPPPADRFV